MVKRSVNLSTLRPMSRGALSLCLLGSVAMAQPATDGREPDAFLNRQRSIEERIRQEFEAEVGDTQRTLFDWGGWYSSYIFLFDDGVESSRTFRRHDMRLWQRVVLDKRAHEFYVRTRLSLIDFNSGDSYDGNADDVEGPNLERGYYRFNLGKYNQAHDRERLNYNVVVTAGRDLVQFGTGLTLATPLDHVALRTTYRSYELTALAGKTVGSSQDFDLSRTNERTRRNFFGGQLRYRGFERHEPFAYVLWQRDRNRNTLFSPFQPFDYDSFYVGIGSTGELAKGLRYATEWVYEQGRGYSQGRFGDASDVNAWAAHAELEYLFRGPRKGRASVEYLFASGDADRLVSPTNTISAARGDFDDTSFIGFGYRDTGLALAPRASNLHMGRVGASYYPTPNHRRFGGMQIGTDFYLFYKHHRAGAISDPTANVGSAYVGWEMDYFANWRVSADLAWTARWGAFFPGDAFSDTSVRTFFLLGLTWSF